MITNYKKEIIDSRNQLFIASSLALIVTSLSFAIRAKIEFVFGNDYGLSKEEIGWAFGPAFWGFALSMFIGGMIIDIIKTKTVIWGAFFFHLIGLILLILSKDKIMLFISNIFIGLANGSVEAACNPLVATIYPKEKTKMLNRFHVWFPGGILIGGLLAWLVVDTIGISWQIMTSLLFIPLAIYGYLFFGVNIPDTERVSMGTTYKEMLTNVSAPFTIVLVVFSMIIMASIPGLEIDFSSSFTYLVIGLVIISIFIESKFINKSELLFPFIFFCMFMTASTELGTNQWINSLLEKSGMNPMIILVVISGVMMVGRYFAGVVVSKISTTGVLLGSVVFSTLGLWGLSMVIGVAMTLLFAIIFAIGICYLWPTMLGFVAEYIPKSGAFGLSVLGGTGMVATSFVLPIMGSYMDEAGPQMTLRMMTVLPAILIVLFVGLKVHMKKK